MATTKKTSMAPKAFVSRIDEKRVARWVRRGNSSLESAVCPSTFTAIRLLDDMRLLLNRRLNVGLSAKPILVADDRGKSVKKFCGELLERCVPNHWKTTLRSKKIPLKGRLTVASSLFSLRKMLTGDRPSVDEYVDKMSTKEEPLDRSFRSFCIAETSRMFRQGWDSNYWHHVRSFSPPTKSNIGKKNGFGTYRDLATTGKTSRSRFLSWAGGLSVDPVDPSVRAEVVDAGGKWRVITLSDWRQANLKPVHKSIYDHLSKQHWLLRGEATASVFRTFVKVSGEEFVSGDYESATDNISRQLYNCLMEVILGNSTHIPLAVRRECRRIGYCTKFVDKKGNFLGSQERGQLMGSVLSFPLLCLINYLTFRYSVGRDVPVKINGDDIVFRATPEETSRWARFVRVSGLKLSLGKTLIHSSVFSLNSQYFHATKLGVTLNPLIRASTIMKKCEDMGALAGRVTRLRRDLAECGITSDALVVRLLRQEATMIYASQGSLARRFSLRVPRRLIIRAGLADRESFYLGLPEEPPPIERYSKRRQDVVPPGWKKSDSSMACGVRLSEVVVSETFTTRSWEAPVQRESFDEYWARVRDRSFRFVPWSRVALRLYRLAGGYYHPRLPAVEGKEKFWVNTQVEGGSFDDPVAFVRAGK